MVIKLLLSLLLAVMLIQGSEFKSSLPPPAQGLTKESPSFNPEPPPSRLLTSVVACPPGQSTNSDGSGCASCGTQCAYCADFDQTCLGCLDFFTMEINPSDKTQCQCKGTQTFSTDTKTCQCPANQWFDGTTCQVTPSCYTSYYNNAGTCESCWSYAKMYAKLLVKKKANSCCAESKYLNSDKLCQQCPTTNCKNCADTTGTCIECIKKFTAKNMQIGIKKTSCCPEKQYLKNGSCQSCDDSNCLACKDVSGDCISCKKKITGTEIQADLKIGQCCGDKEFWNSHKVPSAECEACPDANCDKCQHGTGNCLQCNKKIKVTNFQVGIRKKPSCCGNDDTKYWSSSSGQCENCSKSNCIMCKDGTGDCARCNKKVTGHAPKINIKDCCTRGKYHVADGGCQSCKANCDFCENITGNCLECSKKISAKEAKVNLKKLPSCCADKQYYNSALDPKCQDCPVNCNICKDGDGSCIKCTKSVKISGVKINLKKTSCCLADNNYWSTNTKKCEPCNSQCLMCKDVTAECVNCGRKVTGNASRVNIKDCCDRGKYHVAGGGCESCHDINCDVCENITGDCLECSKKISAKEAKVNLKKLPSCCADKQYYNSELDPKCQDCPVNCNICKDGDGSCIKCTKSVKLSGVTIKLKKTSCCSADNNYWSTNTNKCEPCEDKCLMCKDVTAECVNCGKKVTGNASRVNIKDCCGRGKYHVAGGGCESCHDKNCDVCENITGNCLECSKKIVAKTVKADIKKLPSCCGDNQYYNSALPTTPKCQNCVENCRTCNDDDGTCIRCSNSMKFKEVKIRLKKTSCCEKDNEYWNSGDKKCISCSDTHCTMCEDATGDCINCNKKVTGQASKVSIKTCCGMGQYWKADNGCKPCPVTNCDLCENISGKCLECSHKIKATGAVASLKKQPSCCSSTTQYYKNAQDKCVDCSANCNLCEDVSGNCLKCNEVYKFKAVTVGVKKTSCCPSGNYWNDIDKKCDTCNASCKDCEDVTGACYCKKTIPFRATAGIKPTSCCDSGKYWDNTACVACQKYCPECKDGSGDCYKCNQKMLFAATAYSKNGKCCGDGFYYEGGKCNACKKPCATCNSATVCTSCTEFANFNKATNTCTCKSGTYISGEDCLGCKAPCSACSSETVCTSCKSHATLDSSSKLCNCNSGYTLNSTSVTGYCVANCNSLCTECSVDDGNKCSKCVTNAELSGTKCSCTENSSFDENSKYCVCNGGYTLAYNKCIGCKKYVSPTDVKAANYSSTWTSLNVYFSVKLDSKLDPTCSKVFNSTTLALLGTGPICSWVDQKTLKVVLGSLFTLRNQTMYLDGTYLVKDSSEACSLTYQPLSVAPKASTSPVPTAILSGPSSASLSCGSLESLKYSGEKSTMSIGSMSYVWSSTISPSNSQLSDFIKSQKTASISISRSYFDISVTTTLNLTLQVTNYFGLKSTTWLVTTVTGESSLSVIFDQGSSISMKASSSTTIKAKISTLCSDSTSSTFSWSWKYYSGPKIDSNSILQYANKDKLTINKNALAATTDTPYVFMAIATQTYNGASITGNSTISITVTSSPLSIQLSKTSGDVSPDSDYNINASGSKDPDDSTGSLAYSWTCVNTADSTACIGNDGKTLLSNETSVDLKIPSSRLVKGAQWDITCTISKDVRTASATVTLNILSTTATSSAEIQLTAEKFNPQGNNKFSASVTSNYNPTLLWSVTSGQDITISPNYLSTISLPAGTLSEGQSYTFTLSISAQGKTFTVHLPIYSNLGASCTGSATADPTTGNALTTSFKLSIDGCYDKDEEDYPLTYRYLDTNSGKTYTLGYTTEINYLSTYLFPNENDITIKVCDSLVTCTDYSLVLIISSASRRLSSSALMESYLESTIDTDNIPATISLFCGSATIDSELFSKMWTDLQSYVANNEVTSDLLQNALGATYSMTTQTEQMSAQMFATMAAWLAEVVANNPSIVPSQQNMVTVVALVNNYLSYGQISNYEGMALEDYILNADRFLTYWEIAATSDDLVTQSAMDGTQNTDMTKVFKYRDFPTSMANHTVPIGTSQTISIPSSLSYADTDVMNIKLHYYNISGEASDITVINFANSGSYMNYELTTSAETYVPFSTSNHPFVLEMPMNIDYGKHYSWDCLFYNETSKTWVQDGCIITEIKNNSVVFEVYHFSVFKLSQNEIIIPSKPSSETCGDNFAPVYILIVTLSIFFLFAPILRIKDSHHKIRKVHPVLESIDCQPNSPTQLIKQNDVFTMVKIDDNPKAVNNPAGSLAVESLTDENAPIANPPNITAYIEKEQEPITPKTPNDVKGKSTKVISTEFVSSDPVLVNSPLEEEIIKPEPAETELQLLLEGHMLFGLYFFRHNFSRAIRLFILVTVVIFELLLEGLLIYGFEKTSKGGEKSTETLFNDYEAVYFGYTILALVIATPLEIFMLTAFSISKSKAPIWAISAVIFGILVIIGSIIGIVLLNIGFCFEWSGYWAISFLYGILMQVFVVETLYMIGRYLTVQFFS